MTSETAVTLRRSTLLALIGLALVAVALPPFAQSATNPAIRKPVVASTLTMEQIRALGDNEPIEFQGRITTKAQVRADLMKFKPLADAWVQQRLGQSMGKLQKMNTDLETAHQTKIRAETMKAGALVAKIMQGVKKESPPPPCTSPHLDQVFSPIISPGIPITAMGTCFGPQGGSIKFEGQFPGGALQPTVTAWGNKVVGTTIPYNLTKIADHKVWVSVTTQDGKTSNKVSVDYYGKRSVKLLKAGDTTPICSMAADANDCDPVDGRTFDAVHFNSIDLSNDQGTDKIKASLKNGWVLKEREFEANTWGLGGPLASPATLPMGKSDFQQAISFAVQPATYLRFYTLLFIEGPEGVSHK